MQEVFEKQKAMLLCVNLSELSVRWMAFTTGAAAAATVRGAGHFAASLLSVSPHAWGRATVEALRGSTASCSAKDMMIFWRT